MKINRHEYPIIIGGVLCTFLYIYLALVSTEYAQADLYDLWFSFGGCGVIIAIVWSYYWKKSISPSLRFIVGFALLFRAIGFVTFPVLEDDFYRYLWDGRMLVEQGTPYALAPSDFFGDDSLNDKFESILGAINHPDIATVYGPGLQWLFGLAYLIDPGELWPIKLLILIADIVLIAMLMRLVSIGRGSKLALLLYAWCPLIIKEFVVTAHPDIIAVMLMFAAVMFAQRQWFYVAATSIALAVCCKVFALVVAPLLLGFRWKAWAVFTTTILVTSFPLGFVDAWVPEGLTQMAANWLFNAPLYYFAVTFLPFQVAKLILVVLFCVLWLSVFFRKSLKCQALEIRGDILFGLLLLCLPVFNPWYFIWLLPFAVLYQSATVWVAAQSVLIFSYVSGINLSGSSLSLYGQPALALAMEFGLISCVLILEYLYRSKAKRP